MIGFISGGTLQSLVTTVIAAGATLGIALAYLRRQNMVQSTERGDGWRDLAEQRAAALSDKERAYDVQQRTLDVTRAEVATLREKISHLEGQLAEFQRHDLTRVSQQLSTLTDGVAALNETIGNLSRTQTEALGKISSVLRDVDDRKE